MRRYAQELLQAYSRFRQCCVCGRWHADESCAACGHGGSKALEVPLLRAADRGEFCAE